jgi:steroid 5-alpha reductase family enzyme
VEPERTRACIAIAVAWSALAVVFGAYAIRHASVGPLVLALLSVWCLRLAWSAAWKSDDVQRH